VSTEARTRSPGRPRSAKAHRAILDAALALLGEQGYHRLSMEAVAGRAGVGKTTIYRRWPSKQELVVDALREVAIPSAPEDTGTIEGDLAAFQRAQLERVVRTRALDLLPRLLGDAFGDPELHEVVARDLVGPIRQVIQELVQRGMERGELRKDVDPEFATDVIHGTIVYRLLLSRDLPYAASAMPQLVDLLRVPSSSSAGRASARPRS
jgi:AcrR family transcriptional regulator